MSACCLGKSFTLYLDQIVTYRSRSVYTCGYMYICVHVCASVCVCVIMHMYFILISFFISF